MIRATLNEGERNMRRSSIAAVAAVLVVLGVALAGVPAGAQSSTTGSSGGAEVGITAKTITIGSRKYPNETSRIWPCSGAHINSHC